MRQFYRICSLSVFLLTLFITLPLHGQNVKTFDLPAFLKSNSANVVLRKSPVLSPEQKALIIIRQSLYDHNSLFKTSSTAATWWLEHSEFTTLDVSKNKLWLSSRTYYAYNDNDKVFDQMVQAYDTVNNVWNNLDRIQTSFDASGNVQQITYLMWANNMWADSSRVQYTYTNGVETKVLFQKYESNTYVNQYQYLYTYDSNGNLTEDLQQNWDSGSNTWVDYDRYQYTYTNNLVVSGTYQLWQNSTWVNDERYKYNYTAKGVLSEEIQEKYDTGTNTYTNQYRYKYLYYIQSGKDSAYVSYDWDVNNKVWVNSSQVLLTYNTNGDYEKLLYQDWDSNANDYVDAAQMLYTYDVNANLTLLETDYWLNGQWTTWIKQENFFTNTRPGQLPTPIQKDYVTLPSQIKLFQNFPNPFNPATRISYELSEPQNVKLIVYDVIGRQVAELVNSRQNAGLYTVTFNADKLSSGIYFYRLITNKTSMTKKMILLK